MVSRDEGGREGGCADDWGSGPGDRDACRAGGRVERARLARAFVGGRLVPGTRAGVTPSYWCELFGNSIQDAEGGRGLRLVAGLAARRADGDRVRIAAPSE
jgi:hypothetical protein